MKKVFSVLLKRTGYCKDLSQLHTSFFVVNSYTIYKYFSLLLVFSHFYCEFSFFFACQRNVAAHCSQLQKRIIPCLKVFFLPYNGNARATYRCSFCCCLFFCFCQMENGTEVKKGWHESTCKIIHNGVCILCLIFLDWWVLISALFA